MKITGLRDLVQNMLDQFPGTPLEIINEIGDIVKEEARAIMIVDHFTSEAAIENGLTTREELESRFGR